MKDPTSLRILKIYMHACAMFSNSPVPMDAQAILSFMAAIVNAGPELFHWLNAFRVVITEWKQPKSRDPPKLDMELDSDDDDDDDDDGNSNGNFAVDSRPDFLHTEEVLQRICICCDKTFVPAMLEAAALAETRSSDDSHDSEDAAPAMEQVAGASGSRSKSSSSVDTTPVEYLLSQVPWLLSSHMALTRKGFWRMIRLWPDFQSVFTSSDIYQQQWSEGQKRGFDEKLDDVLDQMDNSEENYFDEPPYLCRDDSPQPPSAESSSSSSERDSLPTRITLNDDLLLCIMQSAQDDIAAREPLRALRKIAQLKAVTRLPRQKLQGSMPMVFRNCALKGMRIDSTTCEIETLNLQTPLAVARVQPQAGKIPSFRAVASYFGAELSDTSDEWLSALSQQRLFVKGRSAAELLRPLNLQHNMFGGELANMSARLVKQMLDEKGQAGKEMIQPLFTNAKAMNARKPTEHPTKRQNTGAKSSSGSSSVKIAPAAAAAGSNSSIACPPPSAATHRTPVAAAGIAVQSRSSSISMTQLASAASAASALPLNAYPPAEEQSYQAYSPSHPGYDGPSDISPSGMTSYEEEEFRSQMLSPQHTDPDDFQMARHSSGSKRKEH